jgi:uncharacterized protein
MIAPFCVAVFQLPIYTVAGPSLMGALLTSVAGVFFYAVMPSQPGISTAPDWPLGVLFGLGGFAGLYRGTRLQKYFPQRFIQLTLGMIIVFLALSYVAPFFAG